MNMKSLLVVLLDAFLAATVVGDTGKKFYYSFIKSTLSFQDFLIFGFMYPQYAIRIEIKL